MSVHMGCEIGMGVSSRLLTSWALFFDPPLQSPIQGLTGHLTRKHHAYFHLATRPHQSGINYAKPLRDERQPGADV